MRRAAVVFAAGAAIAVIGLLVVGAGRDTKLAFTLGVTPGGVAATLAPGQTGCQTPIDVPQGGGFDVVAAPLGTFGRPGPQIDATVVDALSGRRLARGTLAAGYPDVGEQPTDRIAVAPAVPEGRRIKVCLRNAGDGRVAVYGNADVATASSTFLKDGTPVGADAALVFQREPRSVLSQFGVSADHAALFKAGWVGPWAFWLLAALVALGVPLLIALALSRAGSDERQ